jgi:DNA-binding NarL/FixJ family response regulator
MKKISLGIVDDHQLFSKSLSLLLKNFNEFTVYVEAVHGKELQEKLKASTRVPEIMLVDVAMPVMDGIQTARWLKKNYPAMRLIALSMNDKEQTIIEMLKAGCSAYLFKDTHPDELKKALLEVHAKGYYNSDASIIGFRKLLMSFDEDTIQIGDKEKEFLTHACSDLTYKEIAKMMKLSERTIDGYREMLFQKFRVQSRTGMALEAIRRGLVKL